MKLARHGRATPGCELFLQDSQLAMPSISVPPPSCDAVRTHPPLPVNPRRSSYLAAPAAGALYCRPDCTRFDEIVLTLGGPPTVIR